MLPVLLTYFAPESPYFIEDYSFVKDSSQTLTVLDIPKKNVEWTARENYTVFFERDVNTWLQFEDSKLSNNPGKWVFVLNSPYVHDVEFFQVRENIVIERTGRILAWDKENQIDSRYFSQHFHYEKGDKLYLRVSTEGFFSPNYLLIPESKIESWRVENSILIGLFFGALTSILIYTLIIFFVTKKPEMIAYIAFQGTILFFLSVFTGLITTILPDWKPALNDIALLMWLSFAALPMLGSFFVLKFLDLERNTPQFAKAFKWSIIFQLGVFLSLLFVPKVVAAIGVFLSEFIFLGLIAIGLKHAEKSIKIFNFYVAWLSFLVCTSVTSLTFMGVFEFSPNLVNCVFVGVMWEALFMSLALGGEIKMLVEKQEKIRSIVVGDSSHTALADIFENPYQQDFKAKKQKLTVMFIDAVGFSIMSELAEPEDVFAQLRQTMSTVNKIIEKHGGSVDRTIGDAVLCSFGYNSRKTSLSQSASDAFHAAIEIQESILSNILVKRGRNSFPFRIGINTTEVVVGNLGGRGRIDFTLIGEGVNFASRLEASCNPFRIVLSESTKELLMQNDYDSRGLKEMFINIKHHKKYFKVYEYNPFISNPEDVVRAEEKLFKKFGKEKSFERFKTKNQGLIKLSSDIGDFYLVDFSESGLGAVSKIFLGIDVSVKVRLELSDHNISRTLHNAYIRDFIIQVKWSRISDDEFRHGFEIKGLSKDQRSLLFACLVDFNRMSNLG